MDSKNSNFSGQPQRQSSLYSTLKWGRKSQGRPNIFKKYDKDEEEHRLLPNENNSRNNNDK